MFQGLRSCIDSASIVSFNIFNTLLLRPYINPADMFQYLEKNLFMSGYVQQRMKAESVFYNKYGTQKEANIDDIYEVLPDYIAGYLKIYLSNAVNKRKDKKDILNENY